MYTIKIIGGGNRKEIAEALRLIANAVDANHPNAQPSVDIEGSEFNDRTLRVETFHTDLGSRVSLSAVNKAIAAKFPHVKLTRGEGYYYIYSDDPQTALKIASLYTTSIHVFSITHQSIEQWVKSVEQLLNQ